ncbi:LysE/ArgO family amino acid transporter [uncultured Tolumonas sp.]|uniref:LysE/ArgO family amino acid transporter n=1 Tax=uncultured Tolumonas sp. TaxID=263765 RepID=UPI0029302515|nr:LysE/ArgO family amino acid transporter [uncultured Tolumonas sp.]
MLNGAIYLQGMLVGASLIVPIGAQNAFVLERGIRRNHALLVATLCFLADAFLITLGVGGAGKVIAQSLILQLLLTLGGAVFLLRYGWSSLVRAWQATTQTLAQQGGMTRIRAVTMTLAVTLLNPHVYLDTVMIQGAVSGQYPRVQQLSFALGSISASFLWFFGLALLASWLAPQLQRVRVQQFIDGGVGILMWLIALGLLRHAASIV